MPSRPRLAGPSGNSDSRAAGCRVTAVVDQPVVLGSTTPRLSTLPLVSGPPGECGCGCALGEETSKGFEAIEFAEDVLGITLFPWQRYWLIHALEVTPDGRFRFRTVLTLISRQNGKSHLLKIVALYFMYLGHAKLVLGAAQSLDISREVWRDAVAMAESIPELRAEISHVLKSTVEYSLVLETGSRYRITAANQKAGRGLSVDLLILDELRTHTDTDAWAALANTTMARPNSIIVGISNAGDDNSVVLNDLRASALAGGDETLGMFEWSAPDGCRLDDVEAWAQANPALGHPNGVSEQKLLSALHTARPQDFRTENLCQRVDQMNAAVDPGGWKACADPGCTLAEHAQQVVVCVDVSYDDHHVTAAAAAPVGDGRVQVEILGAWLSTAEARPALQAMFEQMQPRAVGWFPSGPAAVLGADLAQAHGVTVGRKVFALVGDEMLPEAPGVVELRGDAAVAACQGLADLVDSRSFIHSDDPLLNQHIAASTRKDQGDGWRFARRGAGRNDAAYAAAGAVYLARTLPAVADYDLLDSVF
jgi:hypothetical protein